MLSPNHRPHIGFGEVCEGDPTPEERVAFDAEFMATTNRPLMLALMDAKRRGQDTGQLEEFRAREKRRQEREMRELGALLSGAQPKRVVRLPRRRPRLRDRRAVGCPRHRGSRRSTSTASRAGPDDDSGESDPGDDYSSLVAGAIGGRRG